jgi:hypothetical protein
VRVLSLAPRLFTVLYNTLQTRLTYFIADALSLSCEAAATLLTSSAAAAVAVVAVVVGVERTLALLVRCAALSICSRSSVDRIAYIRSSLSAAPSHHRRYHHHHHHHHHQRCCTKHHYHHYHHLFLLGNRLNHTFINSCFGFKLTHCLTLYCVDLLVLTTNYSAAPPSPASPPSHYYLAATRCLLAD